MLAHQRQGGQFVHGDIEETLNLACVQVDGQESVGAGGGEEVGHQTGGNRYAGLVFFIGPAVPVIGDHGSDSARRRPFECVDHDQQFHEVVIDRVTGRLDYEDITLPDVLANLNKGVVVGEFEYLGLSQGDVQVLTHGLG